MFDLKRFLDDTGKNVGKFFAPQKKKPQPQQRPMVPGQTGTGVLQPRFQQQPQAQPQAQPQQAARPAAAPFMLDRRRYEAPKIGPATTPPPGIKPAPAPIQVPYRPGGQLQPRMPAPALGIKPQALQAAADSPAQFVKGAGSILKDTAQAIPRGVKTLGLSISGGKEFKPTGNVEKFIYGDRPVKNVEGYGRETANDVGGLFSGGKPSTLGKDLPTPVAGALGTALAALDVTPIGGIKSKAVKDISKGIARPIVQEAGRATQAYKVLPQAVKEGGYAKVPGNQLPLEPQKVLPSTNRPAGELQKAIEDAHNAGDPETTARLIYQLPEDMQAPMRSATGLESRADIARKVHPTTKLVSNPQSPVQNGRGINPTATSNRPLLDKGLQDPRELVSRAANRPNYPSPISYNDNTPLPVYGVKTLSGKDRKPGLRGALQSKKDKLDLMAKSTRSIIEHQGQYGKKIADDLQGVRDTQELFQKDILKQMPTVKRLSDEHDQWRNIAKNDTDFTNFVEATQGRATPKNANVEQAIREWQQTHPAIRERAVRSGLDVGDLGLNYYPHFIDYDQVFKDKNTYNEAINHLVETGQAKDHPDAIKLLGYARDVSRNRTFGNLEASRLVDLPFYDKTPNSLRQYVQSSAKRIAQTETFGKDDSEALKLIAKAGKEGYDTEAMKNAYDIAVGARKYNPNLEAASRNARRYITTTRLGLGALTNVSQPVNTGIVTGHLRTMGAMLKQLSKKEREYVEDTGVISDAVLNDIRSQQGFEKFGKSLMGKVVNAATAPGFGKVEAFNRSVAATAGRDYALRLAQKGDAKSLSVLKNKLGVKGEIKNGTLTKEQQIQASRKIVEKTQFKVDPQDLPGWVDSPGGKLVGQFRTFSYNQGKFFSNEILKPAAKGNLLPLGRLLAALPVGYGLYETRRVIDGRPEEEDKTRVGVESLGKIGGAGLVVDLYRGVNPLGGKYVPKDRRTAMAAGTVGGPAVGQAISAVGAVSEAIQKKNIPKNNPELEGKVAIKNGDGYNDATSLARFGTQQIPVAGVPISNRILPYKKEAEANEKTDGNKKEVGDSKVANEIEKTKAANKDRLTKLKSSLSKEDYELSQLSKTDQQKLVEKGVVKQEKIDGLKGYTDKKKEELGYKSRSSSKPTDNKTAYEEALKKYQKESKGYTEVEKIKKDKELNSLKVKSNFDKDITDLYSLSKAQAYEFVSSHPEGNKKAEKLVEYGDAQVNAGVAAYNKFRKKNGEVSIMPKDYTPTQKAPVERWREPVSKYFPKDEVNKALWVIAHESGGKEDASGDGGHAYGLFQNQHIKPGASVEEQLKDAYRLYVNNKKAGGTGWGDWGEGTNYQGKKFGALGNHPYPGDEKATAILAKMMGDSSISGASVTGGRSSKKTSSGKSGGRKTAMGSKGKKGPAKKYDLFAYTKASGNTDKALRNILKKYA